MLTISEQDIVLGQTAHDKRAAITTIAGLMAERGLVAPGYEAGMQTREQLSATYLANGIAIPHGTTDTRHQVISTGIQIVQFPKGINWGDEGQKAYIAIGIAATSDEHLNILRQLTRIVGKDDLQERLRTVTTKAELMGLLNSEPDDKPTSLAFDESLVELALPVRTLVELVASSCALLGNRNLVNNEFIVHQVSNDPLFLGHGLWLATGETGVLQSSAALLTVAQPFQHQGLPVHGLVMIASANDSTRPLLEQLAQLIHDNHHDKLLTPIGTPADKVALLTGHANSDNSAQSAHIFTIRNPHGLHTRPSAVLLATITRFKSAIKVANATTMGEFREGRSLPNIMGLGLNRGEQITITADGPDAEAAIAAIGAVINAGLGEPVDEQQIA